MADIGPEINCRGVVEVITDYLEGALDQDEARVVDNHLEGCEGCRRYLVQMRTTIAVVGRLRQDDVPGEVRDSLVAAFRELNTR
jgi:anti-sigma factor RsiW